VVVNQCLFRILNCAFHGLQLLSDLSARPALFDHFNDCFEVAISTFQASGNRRMCGGDAREAVKALIIANQFLETDLEKLKAAASMGYARGKLVEEAKTLPRDRKDWFD
jgi:hypothetical protein